MLPWATELERSAYQLGGARFAQLQAQRLASVDSTNSALLRSAQAGQLHPQVLWADSQSAGRGRMGRQWLGAAASSVEVAAMPRSLSFSLALAYAPQTWSGLSLVVGLAVAQVLGPAALLKWPNDICVRSGADASHPYAKLGGILLETQALPEGAAAAAGLPVLAAPATARWLVIGVGLNLLGTPAGSLRTPAVDLAQALPAPQAQAWLADVPTLCSRLVLEILQGVLRFEPNGFAPFAADFAARDVLLGQTISTLSQQQDDEQAGASIAGLALGVAADGSYQIRQDTGQLHAIHSAEVSLRPAALLGAKP